MEHTWTVLVATHATMASLAMVTGAVNAVRRKRGDDAHVFIGRVWVGGMYFTAISSFWIQDLRPGSFSWIHGLSAFTIVTLSLGLWNARRGNIPAHAGNMIGTYLGLLGAFVGVVVVPSRLVPQAFQQNWLGMAGLTAIIIAVGLTFTGIVIRLIGRSQTSSADSGSATVPNAL